MKPIQQRDTDYCTESKIYWSFFQVNGFLSLLDLNILKTFSCELIGCLESLWCYIFQNGGILTALMEFID